ncbi:TlpA family protein disulfide reductase [Aegicerativicinus sediminis]
MISGKLTETENTNYTVYLIKPESLWDVASSYFGTVLDSSKVKLDGSFEFKNLPNAIVPTLLEIVVQTPGESAKKLQNTDLESSNYMPIVWQNGDNIQIESSAKSFQKNFSFLNPSELNKQIAELRDLKFEAYNKFLKGRHWKVEEGSQLLLKEKAIANYKEYMIDFSAKTDQFYVAMVGVRWVSPEKDYERIPELLVDQCEKWKESSIENPWVFELCKKGDKNNLPLMVGDTFPNSELPLISQDTITINKVLGEKLTLIDIWASWCAPCRKENREILLPLWKEFNNKGFQIVAYGLENSLKGWQNAIKIDNAAHWIHASHLTGDDAPLMKEVRLQTIPANFLLNSEGKVIAKNLQGDDLVLYVKEYLTD